MLATSDTHENLRQQLISTPEGDRLPLPLGIRIRVEGQDVQEAVRWAVEAVTKAVFQRLEQDSREATPPKPLWPTLRVKVVEDDGALWAHAEVFCLLEGELVL